MAILVDWPTKVITVPQADLTALGGDVYQLDVDALRLALKDLEDDEDGIAFPDTHVHNTEVTLSGVTYARFVEIINGYSVTFTPAGGWVVTCTGANHNIADVLNNTTGPTLIVSNAAGLVVVGSSLTQEEHDALLQVDGRVDVAVSTRGTDSDTADAVWDKTLP